MMSIEDALREQNGSRELDALIAVHAFGMTCVDVEPYTLQSSGVPNRFPTCKASLFYEASSDKFPMYSTDYNTENNIFQFDVWGDGNLQSIDRLPLYSYGDEYDPVGGECEARCFYITAEWNGDVEIKRRDSELGYMWIVTLTDVDNWLTYTRSAESISLAICKARLLAPPQPIVEA